MDQSMVMITVILYGNGEMDEETRINEDALGYFGYLCFFNNSINKRLIILSLPIPKTT